MSVVDLIAAALCSWRLADLVLSDEIFAWLRRFRKDRFNPARCIFCVTVWSGIVAVVAWKLVPLANYPLAFSQFVLICQQALNWQRFLAWTKEQGPKIVFRATPNGPTVEYTHTTPEEAYSVLKGYMLAEDARRVGK